MRSAPSLPAPGSQGKPVYAYACRLASRPEWGERIYNARSAGEAWVKHFRRVQDAWPENCRFTDVRVRKRGSPHMSEEFMRTARHRGLPHVRCGDRVRVNGATGAIVGHDACANFEVIFDEGSRYAGKTRSCHPTQLELLPWQDAC